MAANPMANRSAALAGAAQALNKPSGQFRQNLSGASNGKLTGANGGTQELGQAAIRRLQQQPAPHGNMLPPDAGGGKVGGPSIPMPPVKPNMAGGGLNPGASPPIISMPPGGDPMNTKPLPGFGGTPPIFAGGQQPGQPPVGSPGMPTVDMPTRAPVFGQAGQQLGVQGPGDPLTSSLGQAMAARNGAMQQPGAGGALGDPQQMISSLSQMQHAPGGPGQISTAGGLPGFMGAPGVHSMPGAPDGGILNMPGGPGQISIHGSPGGGGMGGIGGGGLPTKPMGGGMMGDGGQPSVWGRIAGMGSVRRDPMQTQASGPGSF